MAAIDFALGVTCWHVVGYQGEQNTPVVLCGTKVNLDPDLDGYVGDAMDVVYSRGFHLCRRCDLATGGEAGKYVNQIGNEFVSPDQSKETTRT